MTCHVCGATMIASDICPSCTRVLLPLQLGRGIGTATAVAVVMVLVLWAGHHNDWALVVAGLAANIAGLRWLVRRALVSQAALEAQVLEGHSGSAEEER